MQSSEYYFDSNATTMVDEDVFGAMQPYLMNEYFNPSALYRPSQKIRSKILGIKDLISDYLGANSKEIMFTSCATESNNSVLKTFFMKYPNGHIIVSKIEHPSIYNSAKFLEFSGYDVSYINVDKNGIVDLEHLKSLIKKNTKLISVMYVNNETGVIEPVKKISNIAKLKGIYFHVDAVQAVGKIEFNVTDIGCDYLSISGHKFHGPKGIGLLYRRDRSPFISLLHGGNQESYLRSGTENSANIIGLGKAFEKINKLAKLRNYFEKKIKENFKNIDFNGENAERVCNTSNISIKGINSDELIMALGMKNIYLSSASACSAGISSESMVLDAMGILN